MCCWLLCLLRGGQFWTTLPGAWTKQSSSAEGRLVLRRERVHGGEHDDGRNTSGGALSAEQLMTMCQQDNETQEIDVILQKPFGLKYRHRHVVEVTPGGNADRTGKIEVGMTIVAVNGEDCTAKSNNQINGMIKLVSGSDPTGAVRLRFSKVMSMLRFVGSCSRGGTDVVAQSVRRCSIVRLSLKKSAL